MKGKMKQIEAIEKVPIVWIKIPKILLGKYGKLPKQFKIEDIRQVCRKENGKAYHRNTYQNWLNFLRKIDVIELKGKTYTKKYLKISEGASLHLKKICEKYEGE